MTLHTTLSLSPLTESTWQRLRRSERWEIDRWKKMEVTAEKSALIEAVDEMGKERGFGYAHVCIYIYVCVCVFLQVEGPSGRAAASVKGR